MRQGGCSALCTCVGGGVSGWPKTVKQRCKGCSSVHMCAGVGTACHAWGASVLSHALHSNRLEGHQDARVCEYVSMVVMPGQVLVLAAQRRRVQHAMQCASGTTHCCWAAMFSIMQVGGVKDLCDAIFQTPDGAQHVNWVRQGASRSMASCTMAQLLAGWPAELSAFARHIKALTA